MSSRLALMGGDGFTAYDCPEELTDVFITQAFTTLGSLQKAKVHLENAKKAAGTGGFLESSEQLALARSSASGVPRPNMPEVKATLALLDDFETSIAVDLEKAQEEEKAKLAAQRVVQVKEWISAADLVAADKNKCTVQQALEGAWKDLRMVTKEDVGYKKAKASAKKLERCRKRTIKETAKFTSKLMLTQRKAYASKLELVALDNGMDMTVRARGSKGTTLKFTYVLFNRAWAHKFTEGGSMSPGSMLKNSEDLGFKKVIFSDGYNSSTFYDLEPMSPKDAAVSALLDSLKSELKL